MRVVQTHDEYRTEHHIEQENSSQQDAESSDSDEGLTNSDDDDDDEANVQDENGESKRRRKRKLKDIWNLPKGNGSLCSLGYTDWRKLIEEKDKNTNEERNKKDILEQVKMMFLYPTRMEKYVLRTIGERWRQHKSNLKALHFDANKSMEANNTNVPKGVSKDQWIALVNNWMSQKAQDISEQNRKNCAMKKSTHTAGTESFARNREELRQKDPEKKNPHRAVLYIHTHQHKSQKNMNEHVDDLKKLLVQQPNLVDTSQGKTAWKGDALNKILGVDKPGHIHGLGLVPNPNQVFHVLASRRFKDTHLTSLEDTSSQDVLSVRLHIEKLKKHIKNQDAEILELKEKTKILERSTIQEMLDPMCTPQDALCVAGTHSKRKRVYGDSSSQ